MIHRRPQLGRSPAPAGPLLIDKQGYAFEPRELAVEASRQGLEWRLEPAGVWLGGAVLGLTEEACAELQVSVRRGEQRPVLGKCQDGRYAVEGLATGSQLLIAGSAATGRAMARQIEIAEGQEEVQIDLDFRTLAGPWVGKLRLGDQDLRHVRYGLLSAPVGVLLTGLSEDGRIELYADPGRYRISLFARPMEKPRELEIEIGAPTEQLIAAAEP